MQCRTCNTMNDADAVFCTECGSTLIDQQEIRQRRHRGSYWYALLFIPVILVAGAVGYYKYFLPDGVAAEVNGEAIRMADLSAAVARMQNGAQASPVLRYQALNELITERLVMQEAKKAGISASREEIASAVNEARRSSGLDENAFNREIDSRYGTMQDYERSLERRITISRLISEKIIPRGADGVTARRAVGQWLQQLTAGASIRIALAEQMPNQGCACCSRSGEKTGQAPALSSRGCAMTAAPDRLTTAKEAGIRYWREKHGTETVSARVTDFGCHVQIDIVRNDTIIGSLRYQDGNISDL